MKIQLKRSNVLEGGAAKEPTVAQMEYGELAVNYNKEDPAIFIKDSNNNIIRISGVGNISDDGLTNVPGSTTPPANPEPGNLWFNSEEGRLYVYYDDGDSQQWVDASPDSWDATAMPDLNDPNNQSGTLDERYVNITGDNMTGNLTIASDKVQLKTDGSAEFAGGAFEINTLGQSNWLVNSNSATARLVAIGNTNNSVNHGKHLFTPTKYYIGPDVNESGTGANIEFSVNDGSAEFAGTVLVGDWVPGESDKPGNTNYGNYIEKIGGFFTNRANDVSTLSLIHI